MNDFSDSVAGAFATSHHLVRKERQESHRRAWARLARPGTWWTGAERVAIAREVRAAWQCSLCRERKAALSPNAGQGPHQRGGDDTLPEIAVDAVHRIITDSVRLSREWYEQTIAAGLSEGRYVELVGVLVTVFSIDEFYRAIGVPLLPLPEPEPGEPSRYRPANARPGEAWVPMIPAMSNSGAESDLWPRGRTGNVVRAMSLVPDEVRTFLDLNATHYLPAQMVIDPGYNHGSLTRPQMELVAARVAALSECFY